MTISIYFQRVAFVAAVRQLFVCFEANFLAACSCTYSFSQPLCLWDAPPCFLLEPAVELAAEWMALCDLAVVPGLKRSVSPTTFPPPHPPLPPPLTGTGMTTLLNNGLNNQGLCYDIMQRSPFGNSDALQTKCPAWIVAENLQTLLCSLPTEHSCSGWVYIMRNAVKASWNQFGLHRWWLFPPNVEGVCLCHGI